MNYKIKPTLGYWVTRLGGSCIKTSPLTVYLIKRLFFLLFCLSHPGAPTASCRQVDYFIVLLGK